MALNTGAEYNPMALNSLFFQKKSPSFCPKKGRSPQTPVCDTFESLPSYTFTPLTLVKETRGSGLPFYDIFNPQKVSLSKISNTLLRVIGGLGPSQSKILATSMMVKFQFGNFMFV